MAGYIIEHEGKQYDPSGTVQVSDPEQHNLDLQAAELARWQGKPERALAYISKNSDGKLRCTTWLGAELGRIIVRSRHYNNLTGSRMEYVKIAGNNGATYYGKYGCDWSQAVLLHKTKK